MSQIDKALAMQATLNLLNLCKRGCVHVVGRTKYRSAQVRDIILEGERDWVAPIENTLKSKDNHVVVIIQVGWGENGWPEGTYYIFLHDFIFQIGKEVVWKEF
jgi:hypothetical protein